MADIERFHEHLRIMGVAGNHEPVFNFFALHYKMPDRYYHDLTHIDELLCYLPDIEVEDIPSMLLAIWGHDCIYTPGLRINEVLSAQATREIATSLGIEGRTGERAYRLVLATDHFGDFVPTTRDELLIRDMDTAILGAPPDRYARYTRQIHNENRHLVSPEQYLDLRQRVLEHFLSRGDDLYATSHFKENYGMQAAENMRREIASLRDGRLFLP